MEGTMGEIRLFGGTFAPMYWQYCNGQLLSIAEYSALYALLGTTYGGDGVTTFALPNLQSRVAVGTGQMLGGSNYYLGEVAGVENEMLTLNQMPGHTHMLVENITASAGIPATNDEASASEPENTGYAIPSNGLAMYNPTATTGAAMGVSTGTYSATFTMSMSGGNTPHNNVQPYLGMNFIICVEGIFPSRN